MRRFLRRITLILFCAIVLAAINAEAASDYLLKIEEGYSFPTNDSGDILILVGEGDITGDGKSEWVFRHENKIGLYHLNHLNKFVLWEEYTFESPLTAAILADLDGDGTPEVIVAHDDIGVVDVIGWTGKEWWRSYSRVYLWSEVVNLDVLTLSGFPFPTILAICADGSLNILRWNGVNPELQWTSTKLSGKKIIYAGAGDFDGDGNTDFALVVNGAELQIFSPAKSRLQPVWSNFPWGGIAGIEVLDLDNNGLDEIVTATPMGLLYAFQFTNGSYSQKWRYESLPGIPESLEKLVLPTSNRLALVAKVNNKMVIWPLFSYGSPQYRTDIPIVETKWQQLRNPDNDIVGVTSAGLTLRIVEYPLSKVNIEFYQRNDQFKKLNPLLSEGQLWLPIVELAPLFSLRVDLNSISNLLYLSQTRVFIIIDPRDKTIWVNGLPFKTTEVRNINGRTCFSLPFAEEFFNFQSFWLGSEAYLFPNQ